MMDQLRESQEQLQAKLNEYLRKSYEAKSKMTLQLMQLFCDTTGHSPEELCLVERELREGMEFKKVFYFDVKSNHFGGRQGEKNVIENCDSGTKKPKVEVEDEAVPDE